MLGQETLDFGGPEGDRPLKSSGHHELESLHWPRPRPRVFPLTTSLDYKGARSIVQKMTIIFI
jgi:hypothetical protein